MEKNSLPFGSPLIIYYNESYTRENIDTECAFVIPNMEAAKIPAPEAPVAVRRMEGIPSAATAIVAEDF